MSDNKLEGQYLWSAGDAKTRDWFAAQWAAWPRRVDERCTTNISFLYGGILAFRIEHGTEPEMSDDFKQHVQWFDEHAPKKELSRD